jgi:hypothetical protein
MYIHSIYIFICNSRGVQVSTAVHVDIRVHYLYMNQITYLLAYIIVRPDPDSPSHFVHNQVAFSGRVDKALEDI